MTWIAILSAGLLPPTFDMVRVTSVTPMTMNMPYHSASLPIPRKLADESLQHTSSDLSHDDGGKVHLTISVDVSGILPEGLWDPRTGTMVVNLEKIYILTIKTFAQLQNLKVDYVKKAKQDLCWDCFRIGILKRNFKLWLQTSPYNTPGFPYGRFFAVNYDMTWQEVLNTHQIPHDCRQIHLRAHHSEGTLD